MDVGSGPPVVIAHEMHVAGDPDPAYISNQPRRAAFANPYAPTPATAAGVADHLWTCKEMAALPD